MPAAKHPIIPSVKKTQSIGSNNVQKNLIIDTFFLLNTSSPSSLVLSFSHINWEL